MSKLSQNGKKNPSNQNGFEHISVDMSFGVMPMPSCMPNQQPLRIFLRRRKKQQHSKKVNGS